MIQRASDPNTSRMNWRVSPVGGREGAPEVLRGRTARAWPFLSKEVQRPAAQGAPNPPRNDSGS
jgi:hypothetical protein